MGPGESWKHWKNGTHYKVVAVALHTEREGEELVVYRKVGEEDGQLYARPLEMWFEEARPGVPRFVRVG